METDAAILAWIDRKVGQGRGAVQFGYTENGDVGVWIGEMAGDCLGCGDNAAEAVSTAIRLSKEAVHKGGLMPTEERDTKRLLGARNLFATTASPTEQEVWDECAREFGHVWLATALQIRSALVAARTELRHRHGRGPSRRA